MRHHFLCSFPEAAVAAKLQNRSANSLPPFFVCPLIARKSRCRSLRRLRCAPRRSLRCSRTPLCDGWVPPPKKAKPHLSSAASAEEEGFTSPRRKARLHIFTRSCFCPREGRKRMTFRGRKLEKGAMAGYSRIFRINIQQP